MHGQHRGRLGEDRRAGPCAERRLAAAAAERRRDVALALLQQDHQQQDGAHEDVEGGQK